MHNQNQHKGEEPMTDFQYKNIIEMIYQILKANFEAGKTPEGILAIIAALKDESESRNKLDDSLRKEIDLFQSRCAELEHELEVLKNKQD